MPRFDDILQVELERALEPVIRRLEQLERCHCQDGRSAPAVPSMATAETTEHHP